MSENKPPSQAMVLYEAARFAGFDAAKGWPVELETVALACLMAEEVDCKYGNRADLWLNMLDDAAKAGSLRARAVPLNSDGDEIIIISARSHWYYVPRDAFAAWLRSIGENPNAFVRAWLGDAWQEEVQEAMKAAPAATPVPAEATKERRIAAIVATAYSLKYEPQKIAWGGKAAIKAECLKDAKLFTDSTFDKAWQAAVKAEKIKVGEFGNLCEAITRKPAPLLVGE